MENWRDGKLSHGKHPATRKAATGQRYFQCKITLPPKPLYHIDISLHFANQFAHYETTGRTWQKHQPEQHKDCNETIMGLSRIVWRELLEKGGAEGGIRVLPLRQEFKSPDAIHRQPNLVVVVSCNRPCSRAVRRAEIPTRRKISAFCKS